jgi:polysaccharide biosynthesis protein PslG
MDEWPMPAARRLGTQREAAVTGSVPRRAPNPLRALATAALSIALALMLAAPAGAADQLLGAQSHATWSSVSPSEMRRELDMLAFAGGKVVRTDISWSSLESEGKGEYSPWFVERFDAFLDHAEARGIEVIATLWSTPCWASTAPAEAKQGCTGSWWDREVDRYEPTSPDHFADAAEWVARRWGGRLAALEIWNEPNEPDHRFLIAPDNGRSYAGLLRAAYPRIKQAAPDLPVLGGAMAFSDEEWVERLYELGAGDSFDGLSLHPYNEWRDPDDAWKPQWRKYTFLTGVPAMHELLRRHGDGHKSLWLTEFGFSSCGNGDRWCVSEQQQADYVADSLRIVRNWDFVAAAVVYNLRNKGSDPTDREHQFGLVHRDFTPKPAYAAFARALAEAPPDTRQLGKPPRTRGGFVRIVDRGLVSHRRKPVLRVGLRCRRDRCVGRLQLVVLTAGKRARASRAGRVARRFSIRPGATRVVRVRLPGRFARALRRGGRVRVVAHARVRAASDTRRSFVVRRKRAP